ncbi:MAG: TIGR03986 family CRISPR-associated RAMP protein, partial [bacterium]
GKVSHDVPFRDAVSGSIEYSIEAKTPIFVRNGHSKEEAKDKSESYESFSNINGKYFIPATTMKGAVRNVLEILSFSKMKVSPNIRFAQKNDNSDVKSSIHCGWLKKKDNTYFIEDCGRNFKRVNHRRIDEFYFNHSKKFEKEFSKASKDDLDNLRDVGDVNYDPKTAVYKYKLIKEINKDLKVWYIDDLDYDKKSGYGRVRLIDNDIESAKEGILVLTGQSALWDTKRGEGAGKFYEFIFPNANTMNNISIKNEEFEKYESIYSNSEDWKYHSRNLESSGIPVFFIKDNSSIKWFGLTYYISKSPFNRTVGEVLSPSHREERLDLSETIFGTESKNNKLKGRVQFSHAFAVNEPKAGEPVTLILGSPKASYYPLYIKQDGSVFKTYNDGKLSGWKRYVNRDATWQKKMDNKNLDTIISPLKAGAKFSGKIYFHNLKQEELGAVLSALTFCGNEDKCYHQVGQAKPYGYGKIQISEVKITTSDCQIDKDISIDLFKEMMYHFNLSWDMTDSIKMLMSLSSENVVNKPEYEYMSLDTKGTNEFIDAKSSVNNFKSFFDLPAYRKIELITDDDKNKFEENKIKREEEYAAIEREKQKAEDLKRKQKVEEQEQAQKNREVEYISRGLNLDATKGPKICIQEVDKYCKKTTKPLQDKDLEHFIAIFKNLKERCSTEKKIEKEWKNINFEYKCDKTWNIDIQVLKENNII